MPRNHESAMSHNRSNRSNGQRHPVQRNRRNVLTVAGIAFASILASFTEPALAQQPATAIGEIDAVPAHPATMNSVEFKNGSLKLAGNLYLPEGFDAGKKYAAIVVVHPGGGVKEQIAGLYAKMLAEQGFVTLA